MTLDDPASAEMVLRAIENSTDLIIPRTQRTLQGVSNIIKGRPQPTGERNSAVLYLPLTKLTIILFTVLSKIIE